MLFFFINNILYNLEMFEYFSSESDNNDLFPIYIKKDSLKMSNENSLNLQKGQGKLEAIGTINFPKSFTSIPQVFTQIIGTDSTKNNIYSIQIQNITTTGFSYSKNKIIMSEGEYKILQMIPSDDVSFIWFATL